MRILQEGTKRIRASFIVCGDIDFQKGFSFDSVNVRKAFEVRGGSFPDFLEAEFSAMPFNIIKSEEGVR